MRISLLAAGIVAFGAVVVFASSGTDQRWQDAGKDWKSVVTVHRDPASGMCSLTARGSLFRAAKAKPRIFRLRSLCRYDPLAKKWTRQERPGETPIEIKIHSWQTEQTLLILPSEVALFWVEWSEDERVFSTLAVSGPVMCNDIEIGESAKGMIAACVPSVDSARAMFVPDPAIHCHQ
jgi:hypothetical protein